MTKSEWEKLINETHSSVFSNNSKKEKFLALLGRGYFPRQLPPPFNTKSFEKFAEKHESNAFKKTVIENLYKNKWIKTAKSCQFSLAKPGQLRRVFGLPNPAFHFLLSLELADAYDDFKLEESFDSPGYTMSFPVYQADKSNRAFEFLKGWDESPIRRLKERAKGRYLVKSDIARFFPSIYTHSIPWAMHGKEEAKKNHSCSLRGNFIDLLIRNSQDGQTLGIPIGPDTSFIISERILLEIDKKIHSKIKDKSISCFHRVDDYEFICLHRHDADYCLSVLQGALQEFGLELNTLKTEILELPEHIQDPEVAQLRNFKLGENSDSKQLLEYYDLAFNCYKRHPKGTLKYAIKRIPSGEKHNDTIFDFMVQSMLLEPGVIEAVFVWLAKAGCIDKVDKDVFVSCLSHIIVEHGVLGHTSEVAWAIWGFLLLGKEIPQKAAETICEMNDSVVLLLALDAKEKKLFKENTLLQHVEKFMNKDQLYGEHWLLSYEAVRHEWVAKSSQTHVNDDLMFNQLKTHGVSFYNSKDISEYQEVMKIWQTNDPYTDNDIEDNLDDYREEGDESLPF